MGKSHQCEGTGRGRAGKAGLGLASSRRGSLSRVSKAKMSETPGVSASEDNQTLVQTLFPMCLSLCQLACNKW